MSEVILCPPSLRCVRARDQNWSFCIEGKAVAMAPVLSSMEHLLLTLPYDQGIPKQGIVVLILFMSALE